MTSERTEDAGFAGILDLTMGGARRSVPVLKLRQSREWKDKLGTSITTIDVGDMADLGKTITSLANTPIDVALALVLAYDRTGSLGGREWIEENATDREVYAAFEMMVSATYPFGSVVRSVAEAFGPQLRAVTAMVIGQTAESLSRGSLASGPSPTGASTLTPFPSGSRTSSSSSSGPTDSTDSSGKRKSASS